MFPKFSYRLYDVYAFEKERASPFTSRKGKLVDYLLRVTRDDGDKSYLRQLQRDIEESIEYILRVWLLYVSIKILLSFSYPSFFLNFCYLNNTPFSFSKMTHGLCYQLSSQDLPLSFRDEDIYSTADSYCDAITSYFISVGIKMN